MASFYRSTLGEFLCLSDEQIIARLSVGYANRSFTSLYTDQTLTWERDLGTLRQALARCVSGCRSAVNWGILLEFSIPRKESRIDVVLLIEEVVVILEAKSGEVSGQAQRQVEEYALLLHYFHKASSGKRIVPLIVSPEADEPKLDPLRQMEMFPQLATYWIAPVAQTTWDLLFNVLLTVRGKGEEQVDVEVWDNSAYHPVPTIIEAAKQLRTGLSIREIAHSEASEHEIETVRATIQGYVDDARAEGAFLAIVIAECAMAVAGVVLFRQGRWKRQAI